MYVLFGWITLLRNIEQDGVNPRLSYPARLISSTNIRTQKKTNDTQLVYKKGYCNNLYDMFGQIISTGSGSKTCKRVNQSHYRSEVSREFQEVEVPILLDSGPEW